MLKYTKKYFIFCEFISLAISLYKLNSAQNYYIFGKIYFTRDHI